MRENMDFLHITNETALAKNDLYNFFPVKNVLV